ncbi:MAG: diguanylate cyclase, partial [Candidatus Celaenobacter polaris]|nr:diguanylate cyclase [Candidatus Celaenobacter polaris]
GQLAIAISHKRAEDAQRIERAYFEQLFENSPEAIVLVNNESRILRLNEKFTKTFGYTIEEARNKSIDELLTHGEYEKEAKNTTTKIAKGETVALESIRWHKNGTPVDVSILGTPIIFEGGQLAVYGIYRNISDRKIAEEALKQRTEELNDRVKELNCLYKISDIVEDPEISMRAILNESLEIIAQSWKYPEITYVQILWGDNEYKTENFEETNWHLSQNILAYSQVMGTIQVGYLEERPEHFIGPFSEEESNLLRAIADQLGRIAERKLAEDELKEANIKLKLLARTDPLTQLSNRRDALEKIEYEEKRYERSEKPFAIIICDIDDFKSVNDRFGHDAGDEVLKTLANIMRMIVRKQDIVARWGGEEFLLMLPQTDIEGGLVLAEKIRKKVRSTEFNFNGMKIHISLTMGLSIYKESKTIDETISQADRALYMGKKLGKDCVKSETDLIK